MTLRNNLQDQLNYLSEHLSECQFSGFQYAPTASSDITTPTIFSFETRESNNSKSSSVQSVSNVGFLELQSFRAENSTGRPVPSISTTLTSISSYTTEASSAKYTSVVPEAPRRIEEIRPPVRNNYEPSRPLNIQDEISKFESAIPDSALMEIDIDALVEAELAKSTQKTVSLQTNISNYVSNSSITGTGTGSGLHAQQGDRYSGSRSSAQQPTNNTNNSYNSYNNNNSYNNGTRSSYVQDLSPAARSVTAQPYGGSSGGSSGVGGSGGGTGTGTAPASGLRAESTGGGNSAAGKQAESQHLQREMDR